MDEEEKDPPTNCPHAAMVTATWLGIVSLVFVVATQCG